MALDLIGTVRHVALNIATVVMCFNALFDTAQQSRVETAASPSAAVNSDDMIGPTDCDSESSTNGNLQRYSHSVVHAETLLFFEAHVYECAFYRAMHFSAKDGIAIACRLSVRLSVTLVNCDHIGWNSSKIISSLVSLGCSLFATPT